MRGRVTRKGFTLIELLVVISIIGILASLSAYGLMRARVSGKEGAVKTNLLALKSAIEQYSTEHGDYPPSSPSALGVRGNGVNDGIETLLMALQTGKRNGPFLGDLDPNQRSNTDEDSLSKVEAKKLRKRIAWKRQNDKLFEYHDQWGNPIVYIHNRDYGKTFKIQKFDEEIIEVRAAKDPETGNWYLPTGFQIFSLGSDEIFDGGDGDDICHWKS
jgi:prepilin-type N-terminal cleavage/methylation domain-containing protein